MNTVVYYPYMQCPFGHGALHLHTRTDKAGVHVTYHVCSTCHGYWLNAFSANYIDQNDITPPKREYSPPHDKPFPCPQCQTTLTAAHGDNIPPGVVAWHCPNNHGYFFAAEELIKFKKAQATKINYFKLWSIPLPSLASVLLTSITVVILGAGFIVSYLEVFKHQTTQTAAQRILTSHNAFVSLRDHAVLVTATTANPTTLTVHIEALNNFSSEMKTTDQKTHTLSLFKVPSGTYSYYFVIRQGDQTTRSDTFTFQVP